MASEMKDAAVVNSRKERLASNWLSLIEVSRWLFWANNYIVRMEYIIQSSSERDEIVLRLSSWSVHLLTERVENSIEIDSLMNIN